MRNVGVFIFLIVIASLLVVPVTEANVTVNPDGSGDYTTIQAGINAVSSGQIVWLADGVYSGPGNYWINPHGKNVKIWSISGNPDQCIVDGLGEQDLFNYESGENISSHINGITIQNGENTVGCAIDFENSSALVTNCVIRGCIHTAVDMDNSNAQFRDCVFESNNQAMNISTSNPWITRCVFKGNSSDFGGAMYSVGSYPLITNCLFIDNSATDSGGAIEVNSDVATRVINCTFVNNSAGIEGGAINFKYLADPAIVVNSLFSGNSAPDEPHVHSGSDGSAEYCIFNGSVPTGLPLINCHDLAPDFIGGDPFDYRLTCSSPGVDLGSSDTSSYPYLPAEDFEREARPNGTSHDVGYDEMTLPSDIYLTADGVNSDFPSIQAAVNACCASSTIWLADGIYTGEGNKNIDFHGKDLAVRSMSDNPDDCIIDCESAGRGFNLSSGETTNSLIQGLTVRSGNVGNPGENGGGISCINASVTLRKCIVLWCQANNMGGGIFLNNSQSFIDRCKVRENWAQNGEGGGIMFYNFANTVVTNTVIWGNEGGTNGGGIVCRYGSSPNIMNCTIVMNVTNSNGGGSYIYDEGTGVTSPQIVNTIFYNNEAAGSGWDMYVVSGAPYIFSSSLYDGFCPPGAVCSGCYYSQDPRLVLGVWQDFHLQEDSPCIDQGTNDLVTFPWLPLNDYDGESRPAYTTYDIGADEFVATPTATQTPTSTPTSTPTNTPTNTPTSTPEPTMTPTPTPDCVNHGDVNFSGSLTAEDAQMTFNIVLGFLSPTYQEECAADCNGSGGITASDAQTIFLAVLGMGNCAEPVN